MERHQDMAGIGFLRPLQDVAAQFLAAELHLDPDARPRRFIEFRRHAVIERPVQVRQGRFDKHPRHRVDAGQRRALSGPGTGGKPLQQGKLQGLVRHAGRSHSVRL